jgi:hypothetical protein
MKCRFAQIVLLVLPIYICKAQKSDLGTWQFINGKYRLNKNWNLFCEVQLRSLKFYSQFHYHEYKGGLNYIVHPNAILTLAAGKYDTYKEGGNFLLPKNNDEWRLWPQIILNQSIGIFKIEQRYRAEFRFSKNGYRQRFRYRLGLAYPFGKIIDGLQPFQLGISNELFFTNTEPYFERNRLLFAFSYNWSKFISYQVGYLHQLDYKINDETGRRFLQLGLNLTFR